MPTLVQLAAASSLSIFKPFNAKYLTLVIQVDTTFLLHQICALPYLTRGILLETTGFPLALDSL
jgi:hypothetical protein